MTRRRKIHEQQPLPLPKARSTWGGKREGAGRPRLTQRRASERHEKRPAIRSHEPLHIICRVSQGVGSLRKRYAYEAIREASRHAAENCELRIVHMSIQATHLHLIVEAESRAALSRGVQAFSSSIAKRLHHAIRRRLGIASSGRVFSDRYHVRILRTPREVWNALGYVLNNWRHHDEDRADFAATWLVDPYSTGWSFEGWAERDRVGEPPPGYQPLLTQQLRSWLLREGWRKHGLISVYLRPGAKEPRALEPRRRTLSGVTSGQARRR